MIDEPLLMRHAIRYCAERNGIGLDFVDKLPLEPREQFQALAWEVKEDMKYNQLKYFRPFDHQLRFFHDTANSSRRGILAANRIGKTVSTCYETAMHLTGQYPEWWRGKRFNKPVNVMVAGEGWTQVALVLQKELLGTNDIKITNDIGTGAIPRDAIVFDTMRADGANCMGV